ncbi:MAG: UbiA family prenyltransferase [Bryobacterales bacterium]|nr:UbiA family prenyltransferase [Bryobacterales bacterium]
MITAVRPLALACGNGSLPYNRSLGLGTLRLTLDMIKFEHSIFALPFALTGALLAIHEVPPPGGAIWGKLALIVLAMVGARSAGMTFNRIIDAGIDGRNPRTRERHIPAGLLSRTFAWVFLAASVAVFVLAAWLLNPLCLMLSPLALAIVLGYSVTKRFTSFSHLVLGFALGIAPAAAWIAILGSLDARILWLTAAVAFWTAGFDIIYSCQDVEFDRSENLFSMPRLLGVAGALWFSRLLHAAMVGCLLMLWREFSLGWLGSAGIVSIAGLLLYEHSLVKPGDLSRVNAAFFTVNGYVSVLFFVFWAADVVLRRRW